MGWFWGELGESCSVACARHNQICAQEWTRRNILPDVQDYDAFIAATEQADHNSEVKLDVADDARCADGTFENPPWSPWPGIKHGPPWRCGTSGTCQGNPACGGEVGRPYGYSCGAVVDDMNRLCYCLPGARAHALLNLICACAQTPSR